MTTKHLIAALEEIENEKGIPRDVMREAIEAALVSAYRKHYGADYDVEAHLDLRNGRIRMYAHKTVIEQVYDPLDEISLADAQALNPTAELGGTVTTEVSIDDFGRIAAQTAMQVVLQRMREAERNLLYDEYEAKKGEMVNGVVQRTAGDNVFINIGKLEALLPRREQSQGEVYAVGDRIKVFIADVKQSQRGPRVLVSRANNALVRKLFELEVPEVFDKIVEIKAIAREPGQRTKIAVMSNAPAVDPLGACVGARSSRIQAIVRELGGEKIDIVIWDNEPSRFIMNSLSPAKIKRVMLEEEPERVARVLVADDQLSLAIGKRGQNARLAARLTGWKI
ncbi:MAG TPA: transcription termination factor NusA, partial [bacterium]|nr:transcription termination factor NusA [bacterium]